jgi:glycosyltransferase involved in cell wall biosynthesis
MIGRDRAADRSVGGRPAVLYITPVMPQTEGNGLAMRAGLLLEALAARFDVHLFVVPVAGGGSCPPAFARRLARRIGVLDLRAHLDPHAALIARVKDDAERAEAALAYAKPFLSRFCTSESAAAIAAWCHGVPLAAVHVMRLYLAPLAEPFLRLGGERPFRVLDLDDDDVLAHERLARLHADRGDLAMERKSAAEARKFQDLARRLLPRFDRILVGSTGDARRLAESFAATSFAVVPNGYRLDAAVPPRAYRAEGPLRLLFIGTLGYAANADAVRFLCGDILPAVRRLTGREVRIDVIGGGADASIMAFAADPAIVVHGFVNDPMPLYDAADLAVAPIRAGGGTRIKILEAFSRGVPVVSTRLGAEGLEVTDGVHLLLADDATAFAAACVRLKNDPTTAGAQAREAALVAENHGIARVAEALAAAYGI